jgi:hypothetical protein
MILHALLARLPRAGIGRGGFDISVSRLAHAEIELTAYLPRGPGAAADFRAPDSRGLAAFA